MFYWYNDTDNLIGKVKRNNKVITEIRKENNEINGNKLYKKIE